MYQVNITFADGRKGHITELFPTKEAAADLMAVLYTDDTFNYYTDTELQAAVAEAITEY